MKAIKFFLVAIVYVAMFVCASCTKDDEEMKSTSDRFVADNLDKIELISNPLFSTTIRFEQKHGVNALLHFTDLPVGKGRVPFNLDECKWMNIEIRRCSDGKRMTLNNSYLFYPETQEQINWMGEGPVLQISWADMDIRSERNKGKNRSEKYKIYVDCPRVFGNAIHVIEWQIDIKDRCYTAKKCLIDGSQFYFSNRIYYRQTYPEYANSEVKIADAFIPIDASVTNYAIQFDTSNDNKYSESLLCKNWVVAKLKDVYYDGIQERESDLELDSWNQNYWLRDDANVVYNTWTGLFSPINWIYMHNWLIIDEGDWYKEYEVLELTDNVLRLKYELSIFFINRPAVTNEAHEYFIIEYHAYES